MVEHLTADQEVPGSNPSAPFLHLMIIKPYEKSKKASLHCPGIEPESQEWESCMIPLHQQCHLSKKILFKIVKKQKVFFALGWMFDCQL